MMMEDDFKHFITARLYHNLPNTENPNDLIARIQTDRTLDIREVCQSAAERGSSGISATALEYAAETFLKEMAYLLCEGYVVNTGYFSASLSVKGIFHNPAENFDRKKHRLTASVSVGHRLKAEIEKTKVEIAGQAITKAYISEIRDLKSGSINHKVTPGGILKIEGNQIKLVGESQSSGVYFVSKDSGARIAAETADIITNFPKQLILLVPSLPAGSYDIEIVTHYSPGSRPLKKARVIRFARTLSAD